MENTLGNFARCEWCGAEFEIDDGYACGWEIALSVFDASGSIDSPVDSMHDGYLCLSCAQIAGRGRGLLQVAKYALLDLHGIWQLYVWGEIETNKMPDGIEDTMDDLRRLIARLDPTWQLPTQETVQ